MSAKYFSFDACEKDFLYHETREEAMEAVIGVVYDLVNSGDYDDICEIDDLVGQMRYGLILGDEGTVVHKVAPDGEVGIAVEMNKYEIPFAENRWINVLDRKPEIGDLALLLSSEWNDEIPVIGRVKGIEREPISDDINSKWFEYIIYEDIYDSDLTGTAYYWHPLPKR